MSTIPRRVCAALATVSIVAGASTPALAADIRPMDVRLGDPARAVLGSLRYGCVVPRTVDGAPAGWRLVLTSHSAKARSTARSVIKRAHITAPVVLGYTDPRYGEAATTRIMRYLSGTVRAVPDRQTISIGLNKAQPEGRCPKTRLATVDGASQAAQDWVAGAVKAFGTDRVEVVTIPAGAPVTTT